jgi:hypothetical protein
MPIRLKQLELGLPAPTRDPAADSVPDVEAADVQADLAPETTELGLREPADRTGGQAVSGSGMDNCGRDQLPSASVAAPETRAADERTTEFGSESAALSGSRPDQPESADVLARPGDGRVAEHDRKPGTPEDLTLGPWPRTSSPRAGGLEGVSPRGSNGHGRSNGDGAVWPERETMAGPDRPDQAPRDAERRDTAQRQPIEPPSADLRELVERTLATCRSAEGRNAVGSYGNSGLTPVMQRLAAHLPFGGLAPGSEANSLKTLERLTAKLTRLIARNPGRTAEELAATIGDVVRYAYAFEAADYMEGAWLVHRRLKSHGFELEVRRNRWGSPEHKGIFTQWRDPAHQVAFEVQFHTTVSWAVMQQTHDGYIQITDPATSPAERARLRARQVDAWAKAVAPRNCAEFDDFRLEAR